jgi:hypothetical protein
MIRLMLFFLNFAKSWKNIDHKPARRGVVVNEMMESTLLQY